MLVLGNGVDEVILLLCLTLLKKKKTILTCESTFPGYETSARVVGGKIIHAEISREMRCCVSNLVNKVDENTAIAFLCNPHNPTGTMLSRDEVVLFIEKMNELNVIHVIDEAYIHFSDEKINSVLDYVVNGGNAIVMRTFSKAYGLAGLRIGFALGPKKLIEDIATTALALPFRINRFAQRMVPLALERTDILQSNVRVD